MDDVSWGALALALTLVGGTYTWYAYQRRGLAPALRGAAVTLLPLAAYLTKTLEMFTRMADAVGDWATSLVFSPAVWLGVLVAGLSVLLFGASRVVERRSGGTPAATRSGRKPGKKSGTKSGPAGTTPRRLPSTTADESGSRGAVDDDLAEIEAILRKRGIS